MSNPLEHPQEDAISRFATGQETSPRDSRWIVMHLLRGCVECRRRVLEHLGPDLEEVIADMEVDHV